MTVLTSLAKARAVESGRAVPIATKRHVHVSDRPLVFVPLSMAGEANAPLACLVGSEPESPQLLVVAQPRNRDLRFAFAASLGETVLDYVESFTGPMETVGKRNVFTDAPQLVVANAAVVQFSRLLGRSTRFRRTDGEYPVAWTVPMLGRWLTFFAERSEHPGSSAMLAMTSALTRHWATGQSALEDANLAALMAWIDPPGGMTGADAALAAEDPLVWPPAGPATDPTFDNEVLAPLIRSYDAAPTPAAIGALEAALRSQLEPTWRLIWRGLDLLRGLESGPSVPGRWREDRAAFTWWMEVWRDGGPPQAKRDHAVAAARRLDALEREQNDYLVDTAFDDELMLGEYRLTGEAFAGEVVWCDPTRVDRSGGGRGKLRPHVRMRTSDPVRMEPGTIVRAVSRPKQKAHIVDVVAVVDAPVDGGAGGTAFEVTVELQDGMGRRSTPEPGSVPAPGERLCYTTLAPDLARRPPLPPPEETPWTHGGPPPQYVPASEDAVEVWA